jgi:CPA1 family monovalent cation:H+ antiporter
LDEVLNYILFFLVGFEGFLVDISGLYIYLMLAAVSINFLTRLLSVGIPLGLIRVEYFTNHTLYKTLIVGGLKGGLSLALALSIPSDFPGYDAIFDMTYAVVAFTVIVQGFLIQRILVNLQEQRAVPEG